MDGPNGTPSVIPANGGVPVLPTSATPSATRTVPGSHKVLRPRADQDSQAGHERESRDEALAEDEARACCRGRHGIVGRITWTRRERRPRGIPGGHGRAPTRWRAHMPDQVCAPPTLSCLPANCVQPSAPPPRRPQPPASNQPVSASAGSAPVRGGRLPGQSDSACKHPTLPPRGDPGWHAPTSMPRSGTPSPFDSTSRRWVRSTSRRRWSSRT